MSGSTNSIALTINSSNPLSTTNGGIGRSVTPTAGSVLFYDSTGVQQNNANVHWDNTNLGLSIGTTTYNAPLTVQVAGGTTYATALAAYFGSVVGGVAGNLYHITIAKGSYEAALFGINKNTTTGNNVPASYVYLSTFSSTGGVAIGQGNNLGLPNNAALIVTNQVNIPNLSASQAVVTDSLQNLVSLAYTNSNTASTLVQRDSSGNFSAGTITASFSGTATNATNIATVSTSTNATFPIIFVASSTNSNQAPELHSNLNYNPSTETMNINGGGGSNTNLNIGSSASGLSGVAKALTFSSSLAAGNYINIGTNGRNIGIVTGGNYFISSGLDYNTTTPGYQYANGGTQAGCSFELATAGTFNFRTTPSGTNGTAATMTTQVSISNTGVVNVAQLTASNLVATDISSNLVSTNTLSSTVLGNITKVTITTFTSGSGTYTAPTNCTHIRVRMWAAGGGGGGVAGVSGSAGAAGGGGSGGYIESIITSPTSYSYSVGAAGSGGAAGNNNGTQGGASTFGSFTAGGGTGGTGCTASLTAAVTLAGTGSGNGGSPTISFLGNSGNPGIIISGSVACGGNGAPSPMGGGSPRGFGTTDPGVSGASPGAGGSGAISTTSTSEGGGNGAAGLIVIEEYYNG
jgi:hypothetical protein